MYVPELATKKKNLITQDNFNKMLPAIQPFVNVQEANKVSICI